MSDIKDVTVKQLRVIPDERGWLMEILRRDDPIFKKFGQVYITTTYPDVVKGWHYHKKQWDFFTVIKGMAKIVLYDGRKDSPTYGEIMEFFVGEKNPRLIVIPPYVYHGFKGIGTEPAFVLNCVTEPYDHDDPDEHRVDPHSGGIPYDWARKDF